MAALASAGALVVLPWKGGIEKITKKGWKYGTVYYLAMWQGLRGEDLDVSLDEEVELVCRETGMRVVITNDYAKYAAAEE
ncbi:hypothetical protein [Azohydromonas sediminis]|uniref:hypothetical protein n=1 Tax=Azohydromonas sediminis TaxID=2259674 RepID=UPI001B357E8C|nr:hypothetical protein [Azohydromonas sediminis]